MKNKIRFLAKQNTKGFSLGEIMAVIIILGVFSSMAIPNFNIHVKNTRNQEAKTVFVNIYGAQKEYKQENGNYANAIADLDLTFSTIKNFGGLVISNSSTVTGGSGVPKLYLARLTANDGTYSLYILEDNAEVVCTPAGAGTMCSKMGFSDF